MNEGRRHAEEAAQAAVASPLLEDVDLSGARGVLVNITAGSNMSIGEFEEVGEVIRSFTTENATVVVGTVIDENFATCHSLCRQGYLERNRLGGLQVTQKGKYAVIAALHAN